VGAAGSWSYHRTTRFTPNCDPRHSDDTLLADAATGLESIESHVPMSVRMLDVSLPSPLSALTAMRAFTGRSGGRGKVTGYPL